MLRETKRENHREKDCKGPSSRLVHVRPFSWRRAADLFSTPNKNRRLVSRPFFPLNPNGSLGPLLLSTCPLRNPTQRWEHYLSVVPTKRAPRLRSRLDLVGMVI